jgi:hypothetical protein
LAVAAALVGGTVVGKNGSFLIKIFWVGVIKLKVLIRTDGRGRRRVC